MPRKILAVTLAMPGIWDASEAASLLARYVRAADPSIGNAEIVVLPWLDGSRGTIDFLVTHTLGSFLEVEATAANGEDVVVPIGFAGDDGKLAVIEMARVAAVEHASTVGTTAGVGELIQDALDEGAFSILLCHEEPLAYDAGFGAAAALGVKFFNEKNEELDLKQPNVPLRDIARIDISGRSFALLSSRLFIARSASAQASGSSPALQEDLNKLATIVHRDTSILPSTEHLSASAIEFGLVALLGAEVRDGTALVLEASQIPHEIENGRDNQSSFSHALILAPTVEELELPPLKDFIELVRRNIDRVAVISRGPLEKLFPEQSYSLASVPVFQAPLGIHAGREELRRDFSMRLEKIMPIVLKELEQGTVPREKQKASRHA